jgi:MFS family permease
MMGFSRMLPRFAVGSSNRWVVLFILSLVSVFNYLDRTILSILQVPIKAELGLTDSELGALTGLSFALFYTTFALPIARLADRTVRKWVIAGALIVWSVMTGLTGFATSFAMLVVLRIGVAIGEAGSVPASHSVISDYFRPGARATALSFWGLSLPVGTMIGFLGGGWLIEHLGWRQTFMVFGVAGTLFAPLLLMLVREPVRGRYDDADDVQTQPPFGEALRILWNLRAFRYIAMAGALNGFVQHAMLNWNAPFFIRVHGMPLESVAGWLAVMNGLGAGLGIYLSGLLSDFWGRHYVRGYLLVPAIGVLAVAPLGLVQYMTSSTHLALMLGILTSTLVVLYYSCIVSVSHALVPPRMRAFTSAMLVTVANLIGLGLGPLLTGALSDLLARSYGLETTSLRYALSAVMVVAIAAAFLWYRASEWLVREMPAALAEAGGRSATA